MRFTTGTFLFILNISITFLFVNSIHSETNSKNDLIQHPLKISEFKEGMSLSPFLEIWEDEDLSFAIEDFFKMEDIRPEQRRSFQFGDSDSMKKNEQVPSFGISKSAYWFRWKIINDTDKDRAYLLKQRFPLLDKVSLYYIDSDGEIEINRSGRNIPSSIQEIFYRGSAFSLPVSKNSTRVFLMRVESESSISVPINLWSERGFFEALSNEQIIQGLFFGAIIVMFFYNLFLFVALRDKGYLFYILYLLGFGILFQASMNGYLGLYLFPESGYWAKYFHNKIYILSVISIFPLMRYVLNTKEYFPFADRAFYFMQFIIAFIFILEFFMDYSFINSMMDNISSVIILFSIYACIHIIRQGYSTAYYFFFAFFFVMIGGFLTILRHKGVVPVNFLTENCYQMGMALEVILMGFALADRIHVMEREKKQDQHRIKLFQDELEIAKKLQMSTLPSEKPNMEGLELAIKYKPMSYVGGDFYDFHETEDELIVLIADVTGHGIPAAFEASMLKIAFSVEKKLGNSPSVLLKNINHILLDSYDNQYLTASVIRFNRKNKVLELANAGHPSLWIHRRNDDKFEEFRPKGTLIGLFDNLLVEDQVIRLNSGDRIILYTDGLLDGMHSENQEYFGEERMLHILEKYKEEDSLDTANKLIYETEKWVGKKNPDDDITLIIIDVI
ncbi:MAG: SpoIIE family protein phosphatase [Leptospira sp.]|nr:SpoIIE family protein phosphatase [Leptospira sp.]